MSLGKKYTRKPKVSKKKKEKIAPDFDAFTGTPMYYTGTQNVSTNPGGNIQLEPVRASETFGENYVETGSGALAITNKLKTGMPLVDAGVLATGQLTAMAMADRKRNTANQRRGDEMMGNKNIMENTYDVDPHRRQSIQGYKKGSQGLKAPSYGNGTKKLSTRMKQEKAEKESMSMEEHRKKIDTANRYMNELKARISAADSTAKYQYGAQQLATAGNLVGDIGQQFGDESNQGGFQLAGQLLGAVGSIAGGGGGAGNLMPQGGELPMTQRDTAMNAYGAGGGNTFSPNAAPPIMEQGTQGLLNPNEKEIEIERGELILDKNKDGSYTVADNVIGDGYDYHNQGGERKIGKAGQIVIPKRLGKKVLDMFSGGDKHTKVGARSIGNNSMDIADIVSRLPKDIEQMNPDVESMQYENGTKDLKVDENSREWDKWLSSDPVGSLFAFGDRQMTEKDREYLINKFSRRNEVSSPKYKSEAEEDAAWDRARQDYLNPIPTDVSERPRNTNLEDMSNNPLNTLVQPSGYNVPQNDLGVINQGNPMPTEDPSLFKTPEDKLAYLKSSGKLTEEQKSLLDAQPSLVDGFYNKFGGSGTRDKMQQTPYGNNEAGYPITWDSQLFGGNESQPTLSNKGYSAINQLENTMGRVGADGKPTGMGMGDNYAQTGGNNPEAVKKIESYIDNTIGRNTWNSMPENVRTQFYASSFNSTDNMPFYLKSLAQSIDNSTEGAPLSGDNTKASRNSMSDSDALKTIKGADFSNADIEKNYVNNLSAQNASVGKRSGFPENYQQPFAQRSNDLSEMYRGTYGKQQPEYTGAGANPNTPPEQGMDAGAFDNLQRNTNKYPLNSKSPGLEPTYKRGDLSQYNYNTAQEMQDDFRARGIDPREFSKDMGFYDTAGGFGFSEGLENKEPGFIARANAPVGSKDYGDKYSDVQDNYFRQFNNALVNKSTPRTPTPLTNPIEHDIYQDPNPGATAIDLTTNVEQQADISASPSNVSAANPTATGKDYTDNRNLYGGDLPDPNPSSQYPIKASNRQGRDYGNLAGRVGEALPSMYNLGMGLFGGVDTLDMGRINPDELKYRDLSERDRQSANESAAIGRYNMGKRHMSRGQGIGEASNIEQRRQGAMGRINQAENRRYDQIQAQNVGIRNQADLTNLGFQQQETMYGKQAAGMKQNFLAEGLYGTAGLAQNRMERDEMAKRNNLQYGMDLERLNLQRKQMGQPPLTPEEMKERYTSPYNYV